MLCVSTILCSSMQCCLRNNPSCSWWTSACISAPVVFYVRRCRRMYGPSSSACGPSSTSAPGPPQRLQRHELYIKEDEANLEGSGVTQDEAPIETSGSIGTVERYHAPLPAAYTRIRQDLGKETTDVDCVSLAVFAMSMTVGPEGLCPTFFVFGAIPRPARMTTSTTQRQLALAIDHAT